MKTLIIYDNDGVIINQQYGDYRLPIGIPYIEVEIPNGKYAVSVNVKTKEILYSNIEKSEIEVLGEKIATLQEENKALKEELTQIQTSIASLTSLLATTLEIYEELPIEFIEIDKLKTEQE